MLAWKAGNSGSGSGPVASSSGPMKAEVVKESFELDSQEAAIGFHVSHH